MCKMYYVIFLDCLHTDDVYRSWAPQMKCMCTTVSMRANANASVLFCLVLLLFLFLSSLCVIIWLAWWFCSFFSVCSLFICRIFLYLARSHVRETCTSWSHVNRSAVYAFRRYCVNVYNLRCAMTIYYCRFTNVAFQLPQNIMMNYTLFGASFSGFVFCICELCVDYSFKCDSIRWWCASSHFKCWIIMSARVCRSVFIRSLFRWNSFVLACSMWDKLGIFLISDDTPSLTIEILNAAFKRNSMLQNDCHSNRFFAQMSQIANWNWVCLF